MARSPVSRARSLTILATAGVLGIGLVPACGSSDGSSLTDGAGGVSGSSGQGGAKAGAAGAAGKSGSASTVGGAAGAAKGGASGASGATTGGSAGASGAATGGSSGKGGSGGGAAGIGGTTGGSAGATTGGSAGASTGGSAGKGGGAAGNAGSAGAAGGCTSSAQCGGGVCYMGQCCASQASICGTTCCAGGTTCLSGQCVTPGKDCQTSADCGANSYCEIALGGGSSGAGGGGGSSGAGGSAGNGAVCTQGVPPKGKCLPLPPVCDAGGNPPGCVADCQYKPPVGQLSAVAKWTWGPVAKTMPNFTDVWSTPTVGRLYDANCDGKVDQLDPPDVIFVSGKGIDANTGLGTCCQCTGTTPTACHTGVLRMLDGSTGTEIWSLDKASAGSSGFAGMSVALGDIDGDGKPDVSAVTGEGFVVLVDATGKVMRTSDKPIPGNGNAAFGWGGGLAVADMDHDGFPEIAFGATVFSTTGGKITLKFTGADGIGGGNVSQALSTFVDLDGAADGHLELLAGTTAYRFDGTELWNRADLPDGFPGVGDFDLDGKPEVVLVANGKLWVLAAATGVTLLGPLDLPGTGSGGPPTVADFDGDGKPEIGVAMATFYSVIKPDFANKKLVVSWQTPNHDLSSSVTGSSVFDFEGDGKAEVIYADECFLWVFDGQTGKVRFSAPHSSFTGTEASVVADVDGDGHAEILMVSNGADPSAAGWKCLDAANKPTVVNGVTWTPSSAPGKGYRGLVAFGDSASSWVGTRTLWSEHTYHVTNICDDRDDACAAPNVYASIPKSEKSNWTLPWLNDFRQNVQQKGLFDAPDPTVTLEASCTKPIVLTVSLKNQGLAALPSGVEIDLYTGSPPTMKIGSVTTTQALSPGQTQKLPFTTAINDPLASFDAQIFIDPVNPKFHECNQNNDTSAVVQPACPKP